DILASAERLTQVVRAELLEIRTAYGDARRTEINRDHLDLTTEDLIEPQDVVVTLSHAGYAKSQPLTEYQTQRRGGRGKTATAVKDEDFVEKLFVAHTHDTVLCFSNRGKVYWLKVYELPQAGRGARGKPMVNLLPLEEVPPHGRGGQGVIALQTSDRNGVTVAALQVMPGQEIMLISSSGTLVRTTVDEVSVQGRNTQGVRLIRLEEGERLVGIERVESLDTGEEEPLPERGPQAGAGEPAAES